MPHAIFERAKKDIFFRIKLFLGLSVLFNVTYAVFLFAVSIRANSKWFFALSAYYGLFSMARLFLFVQFTTKRKLRTKIVTMLICGYFLLLINLAVATIIFILLFRDQYPRYHEITVIALATYTFASLTIAIIGCVKHLKWSNHLFSCAKLFSLISASVSFIPLTNTMLSTFGTDTMQLKNILFPILCIAVACFIITCAVYMICKAHFDLKVLKNEKSRK